LILKAIEQVWLKTGDVKYYNYSIRWPPFALQIKKAPNLVGSLA